MSSPIIWGAGGTARMLNSGALEFNNGVTMDTTTADPNGVVSALKGSHIIDVTNAKIYLNTDGATAWELVNHVAITTSNASNTAVTLTLSGSNALSGTFVPSNAGLVHGDLVASNNNDNTNYVHLTQTQVSALHPAISVSNDSNSGISLTLGSNQVLSGVAIDSNITHNSLAGVTGGTTGNRKHIAIFDTKANAKLASGTVESVIYVEETEGLYNYCSNCAYAADDDLVLITGDGGNTRWEMVQKMSRTQGDTGWINTDAAVVSAISATAARLAISTAAAIAIKGVRTTVPIGNYDITITGAAGPKYIYMPASLILTSRDTLWDFNTQVPVMVVYWSGTAIVAAPQTEMHGVRDTIWHLWAHEYLGLQYKSGLVFTGSVQTDNSTNPGADDTKTYLWSTAGVVQDEDIQSTLGTGQWAQTLGSGLTSSTAAIFPFFYYNGTFITTSAAMADRSPFIYSGANGTPQWNSGGTLTNSVTGDYIVYHYFATPMTGGWSVFGRPHNAKFTSLATALTARPSQLTWSNYAELKHIYTAIFRVNTGWDTTHRCKLVSLQDYRLTAGTPVAAIAPTSHQSLSGLELAGTGITYGHIDDQAQTIAGAKTFSTHPISSDSGVPETNELIPVSKVGVVINAATEKTTPIDADMIGLMDSADSNIFKKLSWANIKATIIATVQTWTGKQTFDGGAAIKGAAAAPAASYVGEKKDFTARTVSASTSGYIGTGANSLADFGPGVWLLFPTFTTAGGTGLTNTSAAIATSGADGGAGIVSTAVIGAGTGSGITATIPPYVLVVASGTTSIYGKASNTGATTNCTISGFAIRIA